MTERPILFSGPMINALNAGRKTQTRRVMKLPEALPPVVGWKPNGDGFWKGVGKTKAVEQQFITTWPMAIRCPYGKPGDRLWVREKFARTRNNVLYAADCVVDEGPRGNTDDWDWDATIPNRWKPSIHMPRALSRITLEILDVRCERVADISLADCIDEGISVLPLQSASDPSAWYESAPGQDQARSARESYAKLWDRINGAGSWESNPWVWCLTFKRIDKGE